MASTLYGRVREVGFHPRPPPNLPPDTYTQLRLQRQSSIDAQDGFAVHEEEEEAKYPSPSPPSPTLHSLPSRPSFLASRQRSAPPTSLPAASYSATMPLGLHALEPLPFDRSSSLYIQPSPPPRKRSLHEDDALRLERSASFDLQRSISGLGISPAASDSGAPPASPMDPREQNGGWSDEEADPLRSSRLRAKAAADESMRRVEQRMQEMEQRLRLQLTAEFVDRYQRLCASLTLRSSTQPKTAAPEEKKEQRQAQQPNPMSEDLEAVREQLRELKKQTIQLHVREHRREERLEMLERSSASTASQVSAVPPADAILRSLTQQLAVQQSTVERLERQMAQLTQNGAAVHPLHTPAMLSSSASAVWPAGLGLPADGGVSSLMLTHQGVLGPVTLHTLGTRLTRVEHELSSQARAFNEAVAALQSSLTSASSSASALLHSSLQPLKASLKQLQSACDDVQPLHRRLLLVEEEGRRGRLRQEDDWAAVKASVDLIRDEHSTHTQRREAAVATSRESQADEAAVIRQQRQWAQEDRQERLREEKREKDERTRQWREERSERQKEAAAVAEELRLTAQRAVKAEMAEVDRRVKEAVKDHWVAEKEERGWAELKAQVERTERRLHEEVEGARHLHHELRDVRDEVSGVRRHFDAALLSVRAEVRATPPPNPLPAPLPPQTFHIHTSSPPPPPPAGPTVAQVTSPAPPPAVMTATAAPALVAPLPAAVPVAAQVTPPLSPLAPLQPTAFVRPPPMSTVLTSPSTSSILEQQRAVAEAAAARRAEEERERQNEREREEARKRERQKEVERLRVEAVRATEVEAAQRAAVAATAERERKQRQEAEEPQRRQEEREKAQREQQLAVAAAAELRRREEEALQVQRDLQAAQAKQAALKKAQEDEELRQAAAAQRATERDAALIAAPPSSADLTPSPAPTAGAVAVTSVANSSFEWSVEDSAALSVHARDLPVVNRNERRTTLLLTLTPAQGDALPTSGGFRALDITDPAKLYTCGPYDAERTFLLASPSAWQGGEGSRCRLSVYEKRAGAGAAVGVDDLVGSCYLQLDEMWKRPGQFFSLQLSAEHKWKAEQLRTKRTTVTCSMAQPSWVAIAAANERSSEVMLPEAAPTPTVQAPPVTLASAGSSRTTSARGSISSSPPSRPTAATPSAAMVAATGPPPPASSSTSGVGAAASTASQAPLAVSRPQLSSSADAQVDSASSSDADSEDDAEVTRSSPAQPAAAAPAASAAKPLARHIALSALPPVTQRSLFSPHPPASLPPAQPAATPSSTVLSSMQQHTSALSAPQRPPVASKADSDESSSDDDDGPPAPIVRKAATESVGRRDASDPLPPTRMGLAVAAANKASEAALPTPPAASAVPVPAGASTAAVSAAAGVGGAAQPLPSAGAPATTAAGGLRTPAFSVAPTAAAGPSAGARLSSPQPPPASASAPRPTPSAAVAAQPKGKGRGAELSEDELSISGSDGEKGDIDLDLSDEEAF